MLRIKRVEIQGFKSFCEKTEMRFNGWGIAAVVGPNGCGKSNLSDAISWVLGEQSARTLRGTRMQDVIFAGTRDRKPLGMASVTITLVDPDSGPAPIKANGGGNGHAPEDSLEVHSLEKDGHANGHANGQVNGVNGQNGAAHLDAAGDGVPPAKAKPAKSREIVISRRLFRSGESEYLINGKLARLRDIQDLFMGTGLGPESYAIIEQGRIGQILSSKPMDRRAVIEEAAGITRFKTRRRLAEAKLEGAKQNLARVFDILDEVGRQVNSLKRQAAKTRRAAEIRTDMMARLRVALVGRYRMLEREATKIALDLNLATQDLQNLNAEVREREQDQTTLQGQCYRTEAELTEARKRLSDLQLEAERTRSRREYQAGQIAALDQRQKQSGEEIASIDSRLITLAAELEAHQNELVELERQTGESRTRLASKDAEREQAQVALRERQQELEANRQQVLRLLGEASNLRNQLAQVETFLESLDRDIARSRREEEAASGDAARAGEKRDEISRQLAERQMQLESLADQRGRVEADLADRKTRAQETRRELEQQRSEFSRLKARKDSLEEILSHRAYTTETVKRFFTAVERGQVSGLKPVGVLADFVEVADRTFEKAAEEFLHEELEYVVVTDWSEAERGIGFLRTDLEGRATFLVEPGIGQKISGDDCELGALREPAIGPETGIAGRLSDAIRFTNGLTNAPAALLPRLARCFLAENQDAARRLAMQCPDYYFLLSDGACYHGQAVSGGKKSGSGPLALKRELRELTGQVQVREGALKACASQLENLEKEILTLTENLDRLRQEQQQQEKQAVALDGEMRRLQEELQRSNQRLSMARLELDRLARETERSRVQREAAFEQHAAKERERQGREAALEESRAQLEELQVRVTPAGRRAFGAARRAGRSRGAPPLGDCDRTAAGRAASGIRAPAAGVVRRDRRRRRRAGAAPTGQLPAGGCRRRAGAAGAGCAANGDRAGGRRGATARRAGPAR